jgi:hypothetical protein
MDYFPGSGAHSASQANNELLARSVLDGLSAGVAVIDGSGVLVYVIPASSSRE